MLGKTHEIQLKSLQVNLFSGRFSLSRPTVQLHTLVAHAPRVSRKKYKLEQRVGPLKAAFHSFLFAPLIQISMRYRGLPFVKQNG